MRNRLRKLLRVINGCAVAATITFSCPLALAVAAAKSPLVNCTPSSGPYPEYDWITPQYTSPIARDGFLLFGSPADEKGAFWNLFLGIYLVPEFGGVIHLPLVGLRDLPTKNFSSIVNTSSRIISNRSEARAEVSTMKSFREIRYRNLRQNVNYRVVEIVSDLAYASPGCKPLIQEFVIGNFTTR